LALKKSIKYFLKRFREMLGIKQEALASALGDDWNQKKISLLKGKY
jgi:transcriptional regulator with XRE-family HTH domain